MRVASKVGNLPTKFGHARSLGSLCTRQTDGQKQRLLPPSLLKRRHNSKLRVAYDDASRQVLQEPRRYSVSRFLDQSLAAVKLAIHSFIVVCGGNNSLIRAPSLCFNFDFFIV